MKREKEKFLIFSIIFAIICIGVSSSESRAQSTWAHVYGGSNNDQAYAIQQTADGGYIVAGWTSSSGAGNDDMSVLKLDSAGNVAWQKTYGGSGSEGAYSIQQTADGGYIVAGWTYSFGAGQNDMWVLKLDSAGNFVWQKTYGGSSYEEAYSIQQTGDGGYVVAGYTYSSGAGDADMWVLKLDSYGNIVWQKIYGGSGDDRAYSVQQTADGGYIVAGRSNTFKAGLWDMWVLKLDSSGAVTWQKTYGASVGEFAWSVQQIADGNYIVGGFTHSFGAGNYDMLVLKLDSAGNILWQKTFGGSSNEEVFSIQHTADGGNIAAGYTMSFGAGDADMWVFKLDSSGNMVWQKNYGGSNEDQAKSIQQTADGSYIIAGFTKSFGSGNYDMWVLKLDSTGNMDPACTFINTSSVLPSNSSLTGANTSATIATTSISGTNTSITPATSTSTDTLMCSSPPDFSITCNPSSLTVSRGISGNSTCTITSLNGFNIAVNLGCAGLPTGVTCSFNPNPATPPSNGSIISTLTVNVSSNIALGTYQFQVTGISDSLSHSLNMQLTVITSWAHAYNYEEARSIQQTADGGYIVSGNTNYFGAGSTEMWVSKLDSNGNFVWQKTYGGISADSLGYSIQQTADGGYIVSGNTTSFGVGGWGIWILKLNSSGNVIWQKTYDGINDDGDWSIQQTADGGYIVAGFTNSFGAGNGDMWVLKLDSLGAIAWQKTYGGNASDWAWSIQQTADGGYVVAGETWSYGADPYNIWVLKLDSSGNIVWQKIYGGIDYDEARSIRQTMDGGYIVASNTKSFGAGDWDIWVLKLDSSGNIVWQKMYGGSSDDWVWSIQHTADGGYIAAGYTKSFGAGNEDMWVLKLDSLGAIAWQKTYGGSNDDWAYSIQQTADGGYIVAGSTYSFGVGGQNTWVLKLDSSGNMDSTCTFINNTSITGASTAITPTDTNATATSPAVSGSNTSIHALTVEFKLHGMLIPLIGEIMATARVCTLCFVMERR